MKNALENNRFELIKAHFIDPANSQLSESDQDQLNRILSIARLLDRYPIQKNAIALHMQKYKHIKRSQAYEDCRMAMRLFNTIHTFDYDFWHQWLLNDIIRNIESCKKIKGDAKALRVVALEHLNLIRALGEKPSDQIDPRLIEKNTFIIPIQINQEIHNFDLMKFLKLPDELRKQIADALVTEIKESDAQEIMDT
jgi:hypothetical protein